MHHTSLRLTHQDSPLASQIQDPSHQQNRLCGGMCPAPATLFHQRALLSSGFPTRLVAKRIEKAKLRPLCRKRDIGRQGFEWVLQGGQTQGSGCEVLSPLNRRVPVAEAGRLDAASDYGLEVDITNTIIIALCIANHRRRDHLHDVLLT